MNYAYFTIEEHKMHLYADSYCAWSKGTNENSNRLISQGLAQKHFCGICR